MGSLMTCRAACLELALTPEVSCHVRTSGFQQVALLSDHYNNARDYATEAKHLCSEMDHVQKQDRAQAALDATGEEQSVIDEIEKDTYVNEFEVAEYLAKTVRVCRPSRTSLYVDSTESEILAHLDTVAEAIMDGNPRSGPVLTLDQLNYSDEPDPTVVVTFSNINSRTGVVAPGSALEARLNDQEESPEVSPDISAITSQFSSQVSTFKNLHPSANNPWNLAKNAWILPRAASTQIQQNCVFKAVTMFTKESRMIGRLLRHSVFGHEIRHVQSFP